MVTATGRDNSNPEFARILQLLAEINSPQPDEPLAFLQWCRAAVESWRDDFADQRLSSTSCISALSSTNCIFGTECPIPHGPYPTRATSVGRWTVMLKN